jgi:hypothetical protein
MNLISIDAGSQDPGYHTELCRLLEQGNILLLNNTPFLPAASDCEFLRDQKQSQGGSHKNIAYKPHLRQATGMATLEAEEKAHMRDVLAAYSEGALAFLGALLPEYARSWRVDYASFRPMEEQGRSLPMRHRNDLLHLDAFPTRPTHGARILRAFTNLNASHDRVWATSEGFESLAERYAHAAGLKRVTGPLAEAQRQAGKIGRLVGMRVADRSPYDQFMLQFHHYLKSNADFQREGQKNTWAFPPRSTWISFTDQVAHAVVSGQYALEQTCIVPLHAMVQPELAPLSVLERQAGKALASRPSQSMRTAQPA